jgi:hypothetical protein
VSLWDGGDAEFTGSLTGMDRLPRSQLVRQTWSTSSVSRRWKRIRSSEAGCNMRHAPDAVAEAEPGPGARSAAVRTYINNGGERDMVAMQIEDEILWSPDNTTV